MSRDYLQHGRRHAPGGTDPIPNIGGFPAEWICGSAFGISVPSQSTPFTQYDLTAASTNTNAAGTFTIATSSGLTIHEAGFYIATLECEWSATNDTTKVAEMTWNISGMGNEVHDISAFLPDIAAGKAVTRATQGFVLDASGSAAPLQLRQTSGGTATVSLIFAVARLSSDQGDF